MSSVFEEIRSGIHAHVPQLLQEFVDATKDEPWIHLPADFKTDNLAGVLRHVVDLALTDADTAGSCRNVIDEGSQHGEIRLRHGFPDSLVFQEYYILRTLIWNYIRKYHQAQNSEFAFEAIVRVDAAVTLATKASIRGFHRPAFEEQGRWPECLVALEDEWQALPSIESAKKAERPRTTPGPE